jgi:hypothetical protein
MANKIGVTAALLIEKAQMVKDTINRIDQQAGADDVLFRKMIKEYFRPDLRAQVQVGMRNDLQKSPDFDALDAAADNRREGA